MSEAVDKLLNRIERVIKASRIEQEINYAEILGVLEIVKGDIFMESREEDNENDTRE